MIATQCKWLKRAKTVLKSGASANFATFACLESNIYTSFVHCWKNAVGFLWGLLRHGHRFSEDIPHRFPLGMKMLLDRQCVRKPCHGI
jgi:hypothetical protein